MQIANLSLVKELDSWPAGSALRLEATFADGSVRFYHKLKGPPAKGETAVLFDCDVAGALLRIRNREDGGGMACAGGRWSASGFGFLWSYLRELFGMWRGGWRG